MSPSWRIALFFGSLTLLLGLLSLGVYRRTVHTLSLPRWLARSFAAVLIAGVGASLVSRLGGRQAPELGVWLGAFGGAITLGVLISSVLLVPHELGRLLAKVWRRVRRREQEAPVQPERRAFLSQVAVSGAVSLGFGAAGYGTLIGRHDYALETVPIKLAKLPAALDGFSIVQLSDLHVGLFVGEYEFKRAFELIERARADLIVLTGDLLDHDARHAPVLGSFVQRLRTRARHGVLAIPGNHDHYAGVSHVISALQQAGAEVLLNRHVRIGGGRESLVIGGLDDVAAPQFGGPGPRLDRAFAGVPDDVARVLLSHNPGYFPESHAAADLTLSGHTHGGQITLFINPAELVLGHGFVRGHYWHAGSQLYVNRGFGTAGPPARVGSQPEITKLVLTTS